MKIIDYLIGIFIMFLFWQATCVIAESFNAKEKSVVTTEKCYDDTFNIKDFVLELHIQEIKYPDIVLRQACQESGFFKSILWKTKNNPFGFTYNGESYV